MFNIPYWQQHVGCIMRILKYVRRNSVIHLKSMFCEYTKLSQINNRAILFLVAKNYYATKLEVLSLTFQLWNKNNRPKCKLDGKENKYKENNNKSLMRAS